MVGEVEGYLWMRLRVTTVGVCDKRGGDGGGGWGSNAEAEMVGGGWCVLLRTLLGEASKIWEVVRKLLGRC